jgi:hypothetical protein
MKQDTAPLKSFSHPIPKFYEYLNEQQHKCIKSLQQYTAFLSSYSGPSPKFHQYLSEQ